MQVDDLTAFRGLQDGQQDDDQAEAHIAAVTAMVKAYTRDRGFVDGEPTADLAAVIVSSTTRLLGNPEMKVSFSMDDYSVTLGSFVGWTLPELAVLNRYRRRAQ